MANICSTVYIFEGPEAGIKKFWKALYGVANCGASAAKIMQELGVDAQQGFRLDVPFVEDGTHSVPDKDGFAFFQVSTESAWSEKNEFFDLLLERLGIEGVEKYYVAEECGCGYYVRRDPTGKYFPATYKADVYLEDSEMAKKYGIENDDYTEEEITGHLAEIFGAGKSLDELLEEAKALNKRLVDEGKGFYLINEYCNV